MLLTGARAFVTKMVSAGTDGKALSGVKAALLAQRLRGEAPAFQACEAIAPRPPGAVPLSLAQRRLWVLDQLAPGSPLYNIPAGFWLKGPLDIAALERSLNEIMRRHEVLRASFPSADGMATQRIAAERRLMLVAESLTDLPPATRQMAAETLAREEAVRPFNLAQGPLFRARLFQLTKSESFTAPEFDYLLVIVLHHIVADAWSIDILIRELAVLYPAFCKGQAAPLDELPIQYSDYAYWQAEALKAGDFEPQLNYWRKRLSGYGGNLNLVTDFPRPAAASYRGEVFSWRLCSMASRQLEELSRRQSATLFMTLLAAFKVLLWRYTGQTDLCIACPVANRNRLETERLVGFLANTLVLRADLSGNPSFIEVLGRIREAALGALANQNLPFERLIEELGFERDLAHSPLVQVMFALDQQLAQTLDLENLTITPLPLHTTAAKLDLALSVKKGHDGLTASIEYATELFQRATIERLARHYDAVLSGIASRPESRISDLPMLSAAERRQLLTGWNGTASGHADDRCVHELIAVQAELTPDAAAVICEGEALSYYELNRRANRLAWHLRGLGAGPEVLAALCIERSLDMAVGILGIMKAGSAYMPLDPAYPRERLSYLLDDAGAAILLTQEKLAASLPQTRAKVVCLDRDAAQWDFAPANNLPQLCEPLNPAYVIYTSGSTGRPKGVAITHASLTNLACAQRRAFGLTADDRVLQFSSISFDQSLEEIFPAWIAGATLVLLPPSIRESLIDFMDFVDHSRLTVLNLPTAFWRHLTAELAQKEKPLPSKLRLLIVGGEQAQAETLRSWRALPGGEIAWMNTYGPTETAVTATSFLLHDHGADSQCVPIGGPIANARVHVLDSGLEPAPVGVPGELYIGGLGVARGYLHRPDMTAERFIPNPFAHEGCGMAGERIYRTGDLARWLPDGTIEFLGRIDQQVKIRGYRIELGEVEAALCRLSEVSEAAVLAREDGSGNKQLTAYLVPKRGAQSTPAALRRELRRELPDYMIPAEFVWLDALPLTSQGKIDRKALFTQRAGPTRSHRAAPRTKLEKSLAGIWADVLGRKNVGIDENFFEIGGHSLSAIQVISRIRRDLGVEIALRALFEAPVISDLACAIHRQGKSGQEKPGTPASLQPLTARPRENPIPLSFAQERLWFLDRLEPGSPFYNMPLALRLTGRLDAGALKQALQEVTHRHEVLRTCFPLVNGQPVQLIAPEPAVDLPLTSLLGLPKQDRRAELQRLVSAQAREAFDLAAGPLLRASIFEVSEPDKGGNKEYVLLLTLHHTIADGWSISVLFRELAQRYDNIVSRRDLPPEPLTVQYADYTLWQREFLAGDEFKRQLAYWCSRLSGAPPLLQLSISRPRPKVQSYAGASLKIEIPAKLTERLRALTRQHGATLFMGLLAAFKLLLSRYSGQDDICVGTPVANRQTADVEELIGCFVNTVVLRTSLGGNPRFTELLARVRTVTLEAQEHQDLPFERLVTELNLVRDAGYNPLFQVSFAMDNLPDLRTELKDLAIELFEVETLSAMFDLSVDILETGESLLAVFEYNTDLFPRPAVERLAEQYIVLLNSIAAEPNAPIGELSLLTEQEQHWLLDVGNGMAAAEGSAWAPQSPAAVVRLVEESVRRFADRPALAAGGTCLTYREINISANRLAHRLIRLGIGPEAAVGVYAGRSIELVIALIAVLKAGGAYVPLDPSYPSQRLRAMLEDCRPAVVLSQGCLPDDLASGLTVLSLDGDACLDCAESNPAIPIDAHSLAYILFTSGSTGRPKGVGIPNSALANRVLWGISQFNLGQDDVILQRTSPGFDVSAWEIFGSLAAGACLVIAGAASADPRYLVELVQSHGVTVLEVVPSLLNALMSTAGFGNCRTLRLVCCGGEAMSGALRTEFSTLFRDRRLYNMYGPTEAAIDASYFLCDAVPEDYQSSAVVPIGTPARNVRLYVLDQHLNPVPAGVAGELYIGGAGLARGYHRQPGLTAERFVPDPFGKDGERLYRTGDLACWNDQGVLEFRGRADRQVKLHGFRIELEEIEARLGEFPGVTAAAVILQKDGQGESRLGAYVETKNAAVTQAELRSYAQKVLPAFMVPASWSFMPELPRDKNGKLQRSSLPPLAATAQQQQIRVAGRAGAGAPASPAEAKIARIWADALGLASVERHDSFFDLGGHSLLAVQVAQRMSEALQADIPLVALFQHPTVAGMAAWLQPEHRAPFSPLIEVHEGERGRPPLYLIHTGVGHVHGYQPLAAALDPGGPIYGIQLRAGGDPAMDPQDFEAIVRDYTDIIRLNCPQGPCRLLGWSLGGLIAIGVAARLSELGASISFAGMIDTDLPQKRDPADWKGRLAEFLTEPEDLASLAALPDQDVCELEHLLKSVPPGERPAAAALWGHERGRWFKHIPEESLRLETSLWRHVCAIEDTFQPPRYAGDLHIFWAKASLRDGETCGADWAKLCGAKTHEEIIDADHLGIIACPKLHASIRKILAELDRRWMAKA
jgi:amino acid adenylation domain-containing protein